MERLSQNEHFKPLKVGEVIEGEIIKKDKSVLFLNLGNFGTGRVYGKEFLEAKTALKNVKVGEKLAAKIIDLDDEDNYVALSLVQADKELAWERLNQKKQEDEIFEIEVFKANKGGLLSEVESIPAFLPVSQLSSEHYPVVEDGDPLKIFNKLQKLIGKRLEVKILSLNRREKSLILSEKAAQPRLDEASSLAEPAPPSAVAGQTLNSFKVGEWFAGTVVRVFDFGALIQIFPALAGQGLARTLPKGQALEGLLPNSEFKEPALAVGEAIRARIQAIRNGKVWLSL